MKQLINATTILSLALYIVPPFAAQAQDLQKVMVGDQAVFCLPNKAAVCPDGDMCVLAKKAENCQANAEKEVAKKAAEAAGTAAPTTDQAATDKAAADKAAADQAAAAQAAADKAAADKAAADQAAADQAATDKAAADKAAAEQAAAEKKAAKKAAAEQAAAEKAAADKAAADQAAADKAASDQAAADKAAADKAAADQAAAAQAATDQAVADKTAADKAAADQAAATQAATDQAAADKAAADKAAADKAAADQAATTQTATTTPAAPANPDGLKSVTVNGTEVFCLPTKATACPEGAMCVLAIKPGNCKGNAEKKLAGMTPPTQPATDPNAPQQTPEQIAAVKAAADKAAADQAALDAANIAAAQKAQTDAAAAAANDPNVKPVEAPVPDQQAVQTLQTVLDAPADPNAATQAPPPPVAAAAAETPADLNTPPAQQPAPANVTNIITQTVTVQDTRTSGQDFAAAPVQVAPGKKSGLSDLEKVGLVALGALVIGTVLQGNKQVVSNTGDRVVVRQNDGSYQVYKDDNALLLQPGNKVTTQTFKDGSTRTIVVREDGTQIVTIRDASGRVLQRVAYDTHNHATVLIDDLVPEQRVDVTRLPRPRPQENMIDVGGSDAALRAAMASANANDLGQKFSLRQIRTIQEVRFLAPTINVNDITFETGSAAIQPTEAQKLNKLGRFITQLITQNPGEVFLIEGHTDAVGSAASNLALSDRRAESVAKALSEYFQVPPENLVVQGYGEEELLVPSAGDERANRRVAVRIITPLLRQTMN